MKAKEYNAIVVQIETAYRNDNNLWNVRLHQINPREVRKIMLKHNIGMQCEKCLLKTDSEKYCCPEHSTYYGYITGSCYGTPKPFGHWTGNNWDIPIKCALCGKEKLKSYMSIDHIIPITKSGLEFDKNNLQYACLSCNIKKSNHTKEEIAEKERLAKEKQAEQEILAKKQKKITMFINNVKID